MIETHRLRSIIKPGVLTITLILIVACIFMSISLYVEYQRYLGTYQVAQTIEINDIKQKEATLVKEFEAVLKLTASRIEAAEDNLERIQKIIASLMYLTVKQISLSFQIVSYHKLSDPECVITRLGVRALEKIFAPSELFPNQKVTFWKKHFLLGRFPISRNGSFDGVLEVRIYNPSLTAYFGSLSKIKIFVKDGIIRFDKKAAISFWKFVKENERKFSVFGVSTFVMLLILACGFFIASRTARKKYSQQAQDLGEALTLSEQQAVELKGELINNGKTMQSLQVSRQSHFKLVAAIRLRQMQVAKWISQSLDVLKQSKLNPNIYISEQDFFDILHKCQEMVQSLSLGLGKSLEKEDVDLKKIISSTLRLFDEKTHKSNISVEINVPEDICVIHGDALLVEVLFMNVLGKTIHRVPKNGVVSISLKEDDNNFHLEIIDNGYSNTESADRLIKKSFDLFLSDVNFLDICRENGLSFSSKKETKGLNASFLTLPIHEEEGLKNNVVKLFN